MSLAVLSSCALRGLEAQAVRVEVHVGTGLPAFHMVGLPDAEVRESRERVRSAIVSSGFSFPDGRVTVNLAPADLPKESGRFDLPIALGVLLASGQVGVPDAAGALQAPDLSGHVFAGELSLTGAVVAVAAPLAIALGVARGQPGRCLVLPADSAAPAAHVPDLRVLAADTLAQVVGHLTQAQPLPALAPGVLPDAVQAVPCLSQVRGQPVARRVLEIAAAGGHSLLMSGPPGVGKSMLAQRLPGLLPPLDARQALEVAALAGMAGMHCQPVRSPPFRAPHHSASAAALVGGGLQPRPGEISLAHHGSLFLDELPEFQRRVLESLREPLESGQIVIARARGSISFPAVFQLVAAMNPCPCGWLGHAVRTCTCGPAKVATYRARISGPLLDRIDLQLMLPPPPPDWFEAPAGETSAQVRPRVLRCRARQLARQGGCNARLDVDGIDRFCVADASAAALLRRAMQRWQWSGRVLHRVLRVARTLADMDECDGIGEAHVAEALQYRAPWPGA